MKILAVDKLLPGAIPEKFQPHLKAETAKVWEMYAAGIAREVYFRGDRPGGITILECVVAEEATGQLRDQLWQQLITQAPGYADYQQQTPRQIPMVILRPV